MNKLRKTGRTAAVGSVFLFSGAFIMGCGDTTTQVKNGVNGLSAYELAQQKDLDAEELR